jgi:hypothetical protein
MSLVKLVQRALTVKLKVCPPFKSCVIIPVVNVGTSSGVSSWHLSLLRPQLE